MCISRRRQSSRSPTSLARPRRAAPSAARCRSATRASSDHRSATSAPTSQSLARPFARAGASRPLIRAGRPPSTAGRRSPWAPSPTASARQLVPTSDTLGHPLRRAHRTPSRSRTPTVSDVVVRVGPPRRRARHRRMTTADLLGKAVPPYRHGRTSTCETEADRASGKRSCSSTDAAGPSISSTTRTHSSKNPVARLRHPRRARTGQRSEARAASHQSAPRSWRWPGLPACSSSSCSPLIKARGGRSRSEDMGPARAPAAPRVARAHARSTRPGGP
jgi:hypothetical protein